MKHTSIILVLLMSLFTVAPAFSGIGENQKVLNLNDCIMLARRKSEVLTMQEQQKVQAQARLRQARGGVLPDVSYNYTKNYFDSDGGIYRSDSYESKFTLSQPIFAGFQKLGSVSLSKSEIKRQDLIYRTLVSEIDLEATLAFYGTLQAQAELDNLDNINQLLSDRLKELGGRVRLGKSRESEAIAVESQIATLAAQHEKAKGDLESVKEALAFLTGESSDKLMLKPWIHISKKLSAYR
jgi:outer membrane protein TolC